MKQLTGNFLLLCWILFGCLSCSNPEKALLGIWKNENNRIIEFRQDGSWYGTAKDETLPTWGTWDILEDEKTYLLMQFRDPPVPHRKVIFELSVSEKQLKLTSPKNKSTRIYSRAKKQESLMNQFQAKK
mgnify:CR=1 FL=1